MQGVECFAHLSARSPARPRGTRFPAQTGSELGCFEARGADKVYVASSNAELRNQRGRVPIVRAPPFHRPSKWSFRGPDGVYGEPRCSARLFGRLFRPEQARPCRFACLTHRAFSATSRRIGPRLLQSLGSARATRAAGPDVASMAPLSFIIVYGVSFSDNTRTATAICRHRFPRLIVAPRKIGLFMRPTSLRPRPRGCDLAGIPWRPL